jgi:basic membrane lipoprotein Med (substrate-binding protein (PBP1-ABC) superfamily)
VVSDDYAKRFLPMDFLLSNYSEEVLKDKNKEAFVFFGGQMDNQRNVRSISTSFVLERTAKANILWIRMRGCFVGYCGFL